MTDPPPASTSERAKNHSVREGRRISRASTLFATGLVVLATGATWSLRSVLSAPDLAMVYLFVIAIAALRFGRGQAVFTAALSVALYDVFLVAPYYTFSVAEVRHLVTFIMMFAVGLGISELSLRARRHALRAQTEEIRSSLLSAVSHDFRTPLAVILGAATTLRDAREKLVTAEQVELCATICEEAEHLEQLITNLLDMTRLSGDIIVHREWVPLEEVVEAALRRLARVLAGYVVAVDLPAAVPLVAVDPILLEQVLVNLLENAAKYSELGACVEVRARAGSGEVVLDVCDRGPGLDASTAPRIFEKFFRGDHPGRHGVGLGLPICRAIVKAHGGSIEANNRQGGGAVFRIRLPVTGDAPSVPFESSPDKISAEDPP